MTTGEVQELRNRVAALEEELAVLRNAPVFRYCTMPGCLKQFDIRTAVAGQGSFYPEWTGEGWASLGSFGHICPTHLEFVSPAHIPAWRNTHPRLCCACGWSLTGMDMAYTGFGIASWRNHLALVYREVNRNETKE